MNVLVTGGSGYLGSVLVKKLLSDGHRVVNLDLNSSDEAHAQYSFVQGDIRDPSLVTQSCKGMDWVFHNVAQVPLAKNRDLFDSVNRKGTENLLAACLEGVVKKVICTSSSAVFGVPKENPVTEATEPRPQEAYGEAKYQGELLCHQYVARGLDVSILRPRTIMGHGRLGIFQILFEWIREGYNVPVLGGGHNRYQFVHVDDFCDASLLAAKRPGATLYNIGAREFGTMREVLEHLCRMAGTGSKVRSVPLSPAIWGMKLTSALGLSPLGAYHALMYGRSMWFDVSKAESELRWSPRFSNNQMFEQSYRWYLSHREDVLNSKGQQSHHRSAVRQGLLGLVKHCL